MNDDTLKDTLAYLFKFHAGEVKKMGSKAAAHSAAATAYLQLWAVLFNTDTAEDALAAILAREISENFVEITLAQMEARITRMKERQETDVSARY